MKHKILGPIALVFVAAVLYAFAAPSYRQGEPSLAGRKAQDFDMQITGASHLSDLRGKVVSPEFLGIVVSALPRRNQSLNTCSRTFQSEAEWCWHQRG